MIGKSLVPLPHMKLLNRTLQKQNLICFDGSSTLFRWTVRADVKHKSVHFSLCLRLIQRKKSSRRGKTNASLFQILQCDIDVARHAQDLFTPVYLPLANTETVVSGCVWSSLATSHLSFTSLPVCSFLWTQLSFPVKGTNTSNLHKRRTTELLFPQIWRFMNSHLFSQWMTWMINWILTTEFLLQLSTLLNTISGHVYSPCSSGQNMVNWSTSGFCQWEWIQLTFTPVSNYSAVDTGFYRQWRQHNTPGERGNLFFFVLSRCDYLLHRIHDVKHGVNSVNKVYERYYNIILWPGRFKDLEFGISGLVKTLRVVVVRVHGELCDARSTYDSSQSWV